MAYSTLAEIQSEFKNTTFSSTTNVTDSDVNSFILQADALINSYVSKRYQLPIDTGSEGFQFLKMLSCGIVAERVRAILEVKQATNKDGNQNPRRPLDMKNIMDMLKDIASGKAPLVGCDLVGSSGTGLYSENDANMVEPEFKKGSTQW